MKIIFSDFSMGHTECLMVLTTNNKELKESYLSKPDMVLDLIYDTIIGGSVPAVNLLDSYVGELLRSTKQYSLVNLIGRVLLKYHYNLAVNFNEELLRPLIKYITEEEALASLSLDAFVKRKVKLLLWVLRQAGGCKFITRAPFNSDDVKFFVHYYISNVDERTKMLELMHKFCIPRMYECAFENDLFFTAHYCPCPKELDPNATDPVKRHFRGIYENPMSLQAISRLAVVRSMGQGYEHKLHLLPPLPDDILNIMLFRDIVPEDDPLFVK
jgi:hypothetical protein